MRSERPLQALPIILMTDKRILYVTQEIAPYTPSGILSDLGRKLPEAMNALGYEIRTFMPKYGTVNERRNQLHEVIRLSGLNIVIDDADHPLIIKVASMQPSRIQVYFIDNDDFFQKLDSDTDVCGMNRDDNDERTIFFARGTMETVKKLRWAPQTIHFAGLLTSLGPLYLNTQFRDDPSLKEGKVVYSVVPGEFATVDPRILEKMEADGIPADILAKYKDMPADSRLLHSIAIDFSDGVIFQTDEPDPVLLERVKALGLPYTTMKPEAGDGKGYEEFYNSVTRHEA